MACQELNSLTYNPLIFTPNNICHAFEQLMYTGELSNEKELIESHYQTSPIPNKITNRSVDKASCFK